jgi:hypothetical protein
MYSLILNPKLMIVFYGCVQVSKFTLAWSLVLIVVGSLSTGM